MCHLPYDLSQIIIEATRLFCPYF